MQQKTFPHKQLDVSHTNHSERFANGWVATRILSAVKTFRCKLVWIEKFGLVQVFAPQRQFTTQAWITGYQSKHGLRPASDWIGCKGSQARCILSQYSGTIISSWLFMLRYGGYPCGLWSLWHSLTISQAAEHAGDPRFLEPADKLTKTWSSF